MTSRPAGVPGAPDPEQVDRWETDGGRPRDAARRARREALPAGPTAADHVARQLVEVGDRLCGEFADGERVTAGSIREQVRRARADFGTPKVLHYLPVLVERAVRHHLQIDPSTGRHDRTGRAAGRHRR